MWLCLFVVCFLFFFLCFLFLGFFFGGGVVGFGGLGFGWVWVRFVFKCSRNFVIPSEAGRPTMDYILVSLD